MAISADCNRLWATSSDGLSLYQVAKCLRRTTQDLGQLAGDVTWDSNNNTWTNANCINKWALYKPIEHPYVTGSITYSQRLEKNHGFDVSLGGTGMCYNSIAGLYSQYSTNGETWHYTKPTTWYRITDFLRQDRPDLTGYDAEAKAPYVIDPPAYYETDNQNYSMSFTLDSRSAAQISLYEILYNTYQSTISTWKYALALKYSLDGGITYRYKLVKAKPVGTSQQEIAVPGFTNGMRLQAEVVMDGFTTYECLWCVVEDSPNPDTDPFDDVSNPGNCAYLHNCKFSFELRQTTSAIHYTHRWSNSGVKLTTESVLYEEHTYTWAALDFTNAVTSILNTDPSEPMPEQSRTLKLISTPIVHYDGGDIEVCEPILHGTVIMNYGDVLNNYNGIDSSLLGKQVLYKANGRGWAQADVDYVEVITNLDLADGGPHSIAFNPPAGQQDHKDILTTFE